MTQISIEKTISNIKALLNDPNCDRLNKSAIKGYLGELYVKDKLEKEGCTVNLIGNQSGYDLMVDNKYKIDVKSSTLKGIKGFPDWGWALRTKPVEKINFTHLISVGYNREFDVDKFIIIDVENLELFPSGSGRFKSVQRSFSLMLDGIGYPPNNEYFSLCKDLLKSGIVKVIEKNENISHHL